MKIIRIFGRNIRDGFRSVFRNFSLSFASITCIAITLIIVSVSILASFNVNNFAKTIREDVTMVVYIEKDTSSDELDIVKTKIMLDNNVLACELKSREDVKNEMMETSEQLKGIMSKWTEEDNFLMDTFLVTVKDIEKIEDTKVFVEKIDEVDYAYYGEDMVSGLITTYKAVQKASIIVVIALIIVTVFLIMNTIKLTIFSRKREISIMRLVGASNFSIKMPFVVEGMVLGLIGSIIPVIFTIYGYFAFYNKMGGQLYSPLIRLIQPEPFIYIASLIVLIIGMLVGMIGSSRAVKKYLKV